MSWKYDVLVCKDEQALDHALRCPELFELDSTHYGYDYRDAFQRAHDLAEEQGHAIVLSTSPFTGAKVIAYAHVRGGGVCAGCGPHLASRGPLATGPLGMAFMCERCAAQARRDWGKRYGFPDSECPWYWPVLDRALND
ncbi:hypothetical protein [Streptomyces sp. NPDC006134]|uniref:hypothetical protein n=1 Tax=Streptomyces sp. NPDC006134 TaxID=3154467 RepID=UPI0033DA0B5A